MTLLRERYVEGVASCRRLPNEEQRGKGVAMLFRELGVITRGDDPLRSNLEEDADPGNQQQMPDFLTLESLTFPIASASVIIVWQVLQNIGSGWADNRVWPLGIAAIIVIAGLLNKWTALGSLPKRLAAFLIGSLNATLLAAAALGVDTQILDRTPNG